MTRLAAVACGLVVMAGGCQRGPELTEVAGTVVVKGQPVSKIHIEFWPEGSGPRSIGVTDEQGRFSLMTDDGKQAGAAVGKHRVVLRDVGIMSQTFLGCAGENVDMTKGKKPRISNVYGDPHRTPLTADVARDQKPIELAADPYSGP